MDNPDTPHLPALLSETSASLETCSKPLKRCLTDGDDYRGAARAIASNPALLAELVETAPALEAAARPPHPDEIIAIIVEKMAHYGIRDITPEQQAASLEEYVEVLAKVPASAIRGAFQRWGHCELYPNDPGRHAYMPRGSELFALAKPLMERGLKAAYRAKLALDFKEAVPPPPPSAEDRAKVAAMLADLKGSLGAGREMPSDFARPQNGNRQEVADRLRRLADDQAPETI